MNSNDENSVQHFELTKFGAVNYAVLQLSVRVVKREKSHEKRASTLIVDKEEVFL